MPSLDCKRANCKNETTRFCFGVKSAEFMFVPSAGLPNDEYKEVLLN